ncbi:hypothetical protein VTP01DRAFT_3570 [Rhizomucor pusillus]|uniref:uncharacterized protein n=1 Tax=Rhizomucor pusillus TaxID=4840 RepID=UPI0037428DBB
MYSKKEDYCRKKDAVAITIPAGYPSSTAMPAVSGGGGGPRRAVPPPPAPSRTATSSMTTAAIDLNALSLCISCSPSDGEKKHAPHPSIDVNKCKRKLSLYGDYNQEIPCHQSAVRYYHPDTGRLEARSLLGLQHSSTSLQDLLSKDNYWIDVTAPTVTDLKAFSKIFCVHPLTIEDILAQEIREKCDVFKNYLFVCFRAFVNDEHNVLKPVSFYSIVYKKRILTFHFDPIPLLEQVYQRVEQLRDYIVVAPDWINYAILDEITDHFAPHIQQLGAEVDDIDDPATLLAVKDDETEIVLRISACRKRVMQLIRLLSTKADVVRVLIKRSESASSSSSSSSTPSFSSSSSFCDKSSSTAAEFISTHRRGGSSSSLFGFFKDRTQQSSSPPPPAHAYHGRRRSSFQVLEEASNGDRMYPDTALYLGDVQDHLITMLQNLGHYETVLARAHSNYLAQISIRLSQTSNSTNHVIGRLTVFATILLPMNLITGLWGMNVKVPGKDYDDLLYFFWIVSGLVVFAVCAFTLALAAHICKDTQNRQTFTQATQMGLRVAATAVITITPPPPPSPATAAVAARKMTVYSFSVDLVIKEYLVLAAKAMQPVIK